MGLSEDEKADMAYEAGRKKALTVLDSTLSEMLFKIMDRDQNGYDHFRKRYIDRVNADEGNFLGSLRPDLLANLQIYDALFERVRTDDIPPTHVELSLGKLKKEYASYNEDMKELKKNHNLLVDALNGQLTLTNKYVPNGGRDSIERIGKLMDDFDTWLEGKIKEKHPHVTYSKQK